MKCKRCKKILKSKLSIELGYGPSCFIKQFGTKKFPKGQERIYV